VAKRQAKGITVTVASKYKRGQVIDYVDKIFYRLGKWLEEGWLDAPLYCADIVRFSNGLPTVKFILRDLNISRFWVDTCVHRKKMWHEEAQFDSDPQEIMGRGFISPFSASISIQTDRNMAFLLLSHNALS
jgi:hypothetical protein